MSYEHFGVFLRELREARSLTREQLAKGICTPKQIYRIEKGEFEPSLYLLNQLSIKFNMDLNEYFKMYFSVNTVIGYEGIQAINNAIALGDNELIKSTIEKYENHKDFDKGENLQHILYGKAICSSSERNYTNSLNYCLKAIMVEDPSFTLDSISKCTYSNVGLSIINCMSINYMSLNREDIANKILQDLLYVLETNILPAPYPMYQASQFAKKFYQGILTNLSYLALKNTDYLNAEKFIEKGIDYSIQENYMKFLPGLMFMKFQLLYKQEQYDKAKDFYDQTICLYKITKQFKVLDDLEITIVENYPEIFKDNIKSITEEKTL
jgi:transcriptional regulator with XRE-family HTH domain